MKLADYARFDAVGLAQALGSGQISADEVSRAALAAAEQLNPRVNALAQRFDEPLAHACDASLSGVPFLIKDLILRAQGVRSEAGSRLLAGSVAMPADTTLMSRFRQAGLAAIGRTTTPEFGFNATTECVLHGPTRNPWDLAFSAGGSSGGSAAAVAAGIVPLAHASDGGGSIRIPASACGLVGLKPSRGRTPIGPDLSIPLMGLGIEFVLTRTVRDCAVVLDVVEGPDVGDMFEIARPVQPYSRVITTLPRTLRIALCTAFPGKPLAHPDCIAAAEATARMLESLGHHVEPAVPNYDPQSFDEANVVFWTSFLAASAMGAAQFLGQDYDPGQVEACTHACVAHGRSLGALDLESALTQMNVVSRSVGHFFTRYDLLVTPTLSTPPAPIGYLNQNDASLDASGWCRKIFDYAAFTPLFNMTGTPAISLPLGMSGVLPVGVQLATAMGGEDLLLQVAATLELAMPWANRLPAVHASRL